MTKCWKVEPNERPTFKEIHESLQDMLTDNEVRIHEFIVSLIRKWPSSFSGYSMQTLYFFTVFCHYIVNRLNLYAATGRKF